MKRISFNELVQMLTVHPYADDLKGAKAKECSLDEARQYYADLEAVFIR